VLVVNVFLLLFFVWKFPRASISFLGHQEIRKSQSAVFVKRQKSNITPKRKLFSSFFNNFHALLFFLSTYFHRQAFFFFSSSARYLQECGAFDVVTVGKRWNHKGKKWRGFHRLFLPFSLLFLII